MQDPDLSKAPPEFHPPTKVPSRPPPIWLQALTTAPANIFMSFIVIRSAHIPVTVIGSGSHSSSGKSVNSLDIAIRLLY